MSRTLSWGPICTVAEAWCCSEHYLWLFNGGFLLEYYYLKKMRDWWVRCRHPSKRFACMDSQIWPILLRQLEIWHHFSQQRWLTDTWLYHPKLPLIDSCIKDSYLFLMTTRGACWDHALICCVHVHGELIYQVSSSSRQQNCKNIMV